MSGSSRPRGVVLGVDQGTGSTKVVAVEAAGNIVHTVGVAIGQTHPRPGWVEQDPTEILDSVRQAVMTATEGLDQPVAALGLSSQRESAVMWERSTGKPLGPVLGWQDRRTADRASQRSDVADRVRAITGLPLDPMFSALKFEWMLDEVDPDRRRSRSGELCLGTIDSWIVAQLTGEHRIEIGNASRTQLADVRTGRWDQGLCDLFSIPIAALPRIAASDEPTPQVAGLGTQVDGAAITGVLADSHAALYAHGIRSPGIVKATYGTGSSIMGLGDAGSDSAGLVRTIAWGLPAAVPAVEGNVLSSGSTLVWLAGILGVSLEALIELARRAPADHDVDLVPAFAGLGAPWWDESATAVVRGMDLGTDREVLARAAVESIALQVEDVLAAADVATGQRVGTVMADGGATREDWLMQLQADLSQRTLIRADTPELSALGAVYLAGEVAGLWVAAKQAAASRVTTEFTPDLDPQHAAARRARWHTAVDSARSTGAAPASYDGATSLHP